MYGYLWKADISYLSDPGWHQQRQLKVVARHDHGN